MKPGGSRCTPKSDNFCSNLTVTLRAGGQSLATRQFDAASEALAGIMPSDQTLLVTLGSPLAPEDESALDQRNVKVAQLGDLDQLPTDWWGFEGVDALIITTAADATVRQLSTETAQLAALNQWVRMGGKLVLGVDRNAEPLLAPGAPLTRFAPGTLDGMATLRQSTVIETYAETTEALQAAGAPLALQVPKLRAVHGKIEAYAGNHPRDLPLVVRSPHGFGEIVFLAFDLELPPLSSWSARPQLLDKLVPAARSRAFASGSVALGQVTTLGFVDLAGQLRGALDQFPGVWLVPFWFVALLVLVYIVCIGPLDYLLVKKVLRRMEATWVSFALMVVIFSAGAYGLAYGLKGRQLRINQVDLVDFDAETNLVRGTAWVHLFSPKIDLYDLSLEPTQLAAPAAPPEILFSWMGLSGAGFGGMDSTAASAQLFTRPYDFSEKLDRLRGVPIANWSSKAFVGRWWTDHPVPIEAELNDTGRLAGTLVSRLDMPLDDCVLLYDRWAYPVHQLRPGKRINVETQLDPQTADTYLRHVRIEGDRTVAPTYDRGSFDIPRIVEIMTSHDLAGGPNYTTLAHQHRGFVDLSSLVKDGRAVLVGRRADPASQLLRDGRPIDDAPRQHWTFYRFVFPVQSQAELK